MRPGQELPTPGEVEVWCIDLDGPDAGTVVDWAPDLSAAEAERASRFRSPVDARRWMVSRVALRRILGDYLGVGASQLGFVLGAKDKPALGGRPAGALHFNLSHSDGVGLVAVSVDHVVGIDVERVRDGLDVVVLARRALGEQEAVRLEATVPEDRTAAFFRAWVRHEAVTKCRGVGLGEPGDDPAGPEPSVVDLAVAGGYAAAVAVQAVPDGPVIVRPTRPWPAAVPSRD